MNSKIPKWLRLIRARKAQPGAIHLTIPFMIGALRTPSDRGVATQDRVKGEIDNLINTIINETPESTAVRIFRCPAIRQPVFGDLEGYCGQATDARFVSNSRSTPSLFVSSDYFSTTAPTVAEISQSLFALLQSHICAGRFSYYMDTYGPYTTDDIKLIESAK